MLDICLLSGNIFQLLNTSRYDMISCRVFEGRFNTMILEEATSNNYLDVDLALFVST